MIHREDAMTILRATIQDRRLELDAPADWPDGTVVEIAPRGEPTEDQDTLSPEEIEATLAAMDRMEPLDWTDAERSQWDVDRRKRIEREKAAFFQDARPLQGNWD